MWLGKIKCPSVGYPSEFTQLYNCPKVDISSCIMFAQPMSNFIVCHILKNFQNWLHLQTAQKYVGNVEYPILIIDLLSLSYPNCNTILSLGPHFRWYALDCLTHNTGLTFHCFIVSYLQVIETNYVSIHHHISLYFSFPSYYFQL